MINFLIFDLDGVLFSNKYVHFLALNNALRHYGEEFVISEEDHFKVFDGLSTRKKLQMLTDTRSLPIKYHQNIYDRKQAETLETIKSSVKPNPKLINMMVHFKNEGYKIYVASNCIRETTKITLLRLGLMEHVDYYFSNEDVKSPKPFPEMYMKAMIHAQKKPSETLIIEDSPKGIKAAQDSGANLLVVDSPEEVTIENIENRIKSITNGNKPAIAHKLNVLISIAGAGKRFSDAGYDVPKPLIRFLGKSMIEHVIRNLNMEANYIIMCQESHIEKYDLKEYLNSIIPNCTIVPINGLNDGAAASLLLAEKYINNDSPLLIANSDQIIEWDSSAFYYYFIESKVDGIIFTFKCPDKNPKWSFVKLNEKSEVIEVKEKEPISDVANVGIFAFKHGKDFIKYAKRMIAKNIKVNGEYYVAPVYNEAIDDDKRIVPYMISKMWGIGTPEDLTYYIETHKT